MVFHLYYTMPLPLIVRSFSCLQRYPTLVWMLDTMARLLQDLGWLYGILLDHHLTSTVRFCKKISTWYKFCSFKDKFEIKQISTVIAIIVSLRNKLNRVEMCFHIISVFFLNKVKYSFGHLNF